MSILALLTLKLRWVHLSKALITTLLTSGKTPLVQLDPELLVQNHSELRDLLVVAQPHPKQVDPVAALGSKPPF